MMQSNEKKFLITGATGFIGVRLVKRLVAQYGNESVTAMYPPTSNIIEEKHRELLSSLNINTIEVNLLDSKLIKEELGDYDIVYHLAAHTRTEILNENIHVNDRGTANLMHTLGKKLEGKRFIFTSSILAVDKPGRNTIHIDEQTPCQPRSEYGISKLKAEAVVKECSSCLSCDYTIVRPAIVYGPGMNQQGLFGLFSKWLKSGSKIAQLNWPAPLSLIYIDDLIEQLTILGYANSDKTINQTYFLASPEQLTLTQVIREIAVSTNSKFKPIEFPATVWNLINFLSWHTSLWRLLPHKIKNNIWRLSLITGTGMHIKSCKFDNVAPNFNYTPHKKGISTLFKIA